MEGKERTHTVRAFYPKEKVHYPYTLKKLRKKLMTNIKASLLKSSKLDKLAPLSRRVEDDRAL